MYNASVIEKIIWQTHDYKYENLPAHFKKCMSSWKILNPDWEHRYVDHEERKVFMQEKYPELYEVYKSKWHMYQADVWRVAVVHEFGGVYVDMDTFCAMPLNYMLQDKNYDCLITEPMDNERNGNTHINNAMFAAPSKCKNLKNIIDETMNQYQRYVADLKEFSKQKTGAPSITDIDVHTIFSKESLKNYNPFFNAGYHGSSYKNPKKVLDDQVINYYGNIMKYSDYLKKILNLSDEEIKNLI